MFLSYNTHQEHKEPKSLPLGGFSFVCHYTVLLYSPKQDILSSAVFYSSGGGQLVSHFFSEFSI